MIEKIRKSNKRRNKLKGKEKGNQRTYNLSAMESVVWLSIIVLCISVFELLF